MGRAGNWARRTGKGQHSRSGSWAVWGCCSQAGQHAHCHLLQAAGPVLLLDTRNTRDTHAARHSLCVFGSTSRSDAGATARPHTRRAGGRTSRKMRRASGLNDLMAPSDTRDSRAAPPLVLRAVLALPEARPAAAVAGVARWRVRAARGRLGCTACSGRAAGARARQARSCQRDMGGRQGAGSRHFQQQQGFRHRATCCRVHTCTDGFANMEVGAAAIRLCPTASWNGIEPTAALLSWVAGRLV